MNSQAITIDGLTKTYTHPKKPSVLAVDNLSLNVKEGSFFGLLGPNGAGKSTLIKCMTGLASATKGNINIFDHHVERDYKTTRKCIGVSTQEYVFDHFLTVYEELLFTGGYFSQKKSDLKKRIPELLERFGLTEKAKEDTSRLSGGMKRRLSIAKALVHQPKLLILDEPTAGLDVKLRYELWDILADLNKTGTTILLTTHYIEEAEHLCDRIVFLDNGKIAYEEDNNKTEKKEHTKLEKLFLEKTEPTHD